MPVISADELVELNELIDRNDRRQYQWFVKKLVAKYDCLGMNVSVDSENGLISEVTKEEYADIKEGKKSVDSVVIIKEENSKNQ